VSSLECAISESARPEDALPAADWRGAAQGCDVTATPELVGCPSASGLRCGRAKPGGLAPGWFAGKRDGPKNAEPRAPLPGH